MKLAPAATAVLALAVLPVASAKSKQHRTNRQINTRRKDCEQQTCASVHVDDRENCVMRCQSPACYGQVYEGNELEPGEIDSKRARDFNACVNSEAKKSRGQPTPTIQTPERTPLAHPSVNPGPSASAGVGDAGGDGEAGTVSDATDPAGTADAANGDQTSAGQVEL